MTESHPTPRHGPLGAWDALVGPGAEAIEVSLIVAAMVAGPGLAAAWAWGTGADWSWWRWLVVGVAAGELAAGLAAGALPAARRWRHRAGQGPRQLFAFAALHIHPLVLAIILPRDISLRSGLIVYGLLLLGAGLCIFAPPRLKAAVGLLTACAATITCSLWLPLVSCLGWLPAVVFFKVMAADLTPPEAHQEVAQPSPSGPWS